MPRSVQAGSTREEAADVFLSGLLFFDLGFTGLPSAPTPGAEVWTKGMGTSPGGIANFAVALRRLGLRTSLSAAFGEDLLGTHLWHELSVTEGVDLSRSRRFAGWPTPVTVSLAYDGDRALVTHGQEPPLGPDAMIGEPPPSRAAIAHIGAEPLEWVGRAHSAGTLVFADVGWDPSERWSPAVLEQLALCHAFMPNAEEAMAYTRTGTPRAALSRLADLVPLAVVTDGAGGALAVDSTTGESASVAGLPVDAVDTTGAGDVFGAGLVAATLAGRPLADRLRFANLVAALSVRRIGGAAAAPDLAAVDRWWRSVRDSPGNDDLRSAYAFLDHAVPAAATTAAGPHPADQPEQ
ncbi:carbohydrate kinase family protein [Actinacidiphila glaucinigra]|uniref:carbohydrate kinase family protein n=1 Tax=Actinacidiphila glaucinigra TaxID=235986 RepID=UPI0033E023B0